VAPEEAEAEMDTSQLFSSMQEQMDARRVFGEPIERGGVTVIPVAAVMSGAGGGLGDGRVASRPSDLDLGDAREPGGAEAAGGGFGLVARPIGAWVIRDGDVHWRPALDLNWVVAGGQLLSAVAVVSICLAIRRRRR